MLFASPLLAALLQTPAAPPTEAQALPPLRAIRQLPANLDNRGAVVLRAQRIEGQPQGELRLQGQAELRHGDTLLQAPTLRYDTRSDLVTSPGAVRIEHLGNQLEGQQLRLQLDSFVGELLEPTYRLSLTGGSGRAARMDFLGGERLKADDASYSSCPRDEAEEPAWELRMRKLVLDLPANEGRAEGAVLRFQGVPILAAPNFSFPLTDERKSGWLPPHVGADNRSGLELALPYYFNLAPNYDLTLTPFTMTRRGIGSDIELRGLQAWGQAELDLSLLPHDRVAGRKRWLVRGLTELQPWSGARVEAAAESVSDSEYWKDLRRRINSPTPRLLERDARASQQLDAWGVQGELYARAQTWQIAQSTEVGAEITAPYQRAPQVGLRLRSSRDIDLLAGFLPSLGKPGVEAGLEAEYNRFTLPRAALANQAPGGERFHVLAHVALPLVDSAWWLIPKLSLNSAHYKGHGLNARRHVPTGSLDAGVVLERDTELFGRNLQQSLEPRLLYVHTPYRAQEQLPLYDSAPLDFNVESLYATNAFSGVDRVSDARQLSFGATSRWLDPDNGEELLRLGLVQRYQFKPQRITPDPGTVNRRFSDLLLAGAAHLSSRWWLDGALQYNPDSERTERTVLRARYTAPDLRTLSLAYRLTRDQSEQLDLAWQWPLTARRGGGDCAGRWVGAGRVQYSLRDSRVTDSLLGVEYDAGCWVLRMGVERLSTGLAQANTRFLLQLELVGLSRLGSNALKVLRDNVPGYRPLASDSGLTSIP